MNKIEIEKILEWYNSGTLSTHEAVERISVVGRSEQLKAVEKLKDFAYAVCPLHREDELEEIVGSL